MESLIKKRDRVREQPPGSNRGDTIDVYLRAFGVKPPGRKQGPPWCAYGMSENMRYFAIGFHTGRAIDFVRQAAACGYRVIDARLVILGIETPRAGWLGVKGRPGGNHVNGIARDWQQGRGAGWVVGCKVQDKITLYWDEVDLLDRFTYTYFLEPDL